MGIKIENLVTLRRVELETSKDQRDEFPKERQPIPKWGQYYCL